MSDETVFHPTDPAPAQTGEPRCYPQGRRALLAAQAVLIRDGFVDDRFLAVRRWAETAPHVCPGLGVWWKGRCVLLGTASGEVWLYRPGDSWSTCAAWEETLYAYEAQEMPSKVPSVPQAASSSQGAAADTPDAPQSQTGAFTGAAPQPPLRCLRTGNPCGTDTWVTGRSCPCASCQAYVAQRAQIEADGACCRVHNRPTADPVYRNSINQIGVTKISPSANIPTEETESVGLNSREAKPANLNANTKGGLSWQQWYQLLWEFKVSTWDKNHG